MKSLFQYSKWKGEIDDSNNKFDNKVKNQYILIIFVETTKHFIFLSRRENEEALFYIRFVSILLAIGLRIRSMSSPALLSRLRPLHSYSMSNQSGRDITRQICEVWRENDEERKMDIGGEKKKERESGSKQRPHQIHATSLRGRCLLTRLS